MTRNPTDEWIKDLNRQSTQEDMIELYTYEMMCNLISYQWNTN